jgi:predicted amidohydrolase YtcJ
LIDYIKNQLKNGNKLFNKKRLLILIQITTIILLFFSSFIPALAGSPQLAFNVFDLDATMVDYIFYNANIITMDESNPSAEAIAIKDGFIQAVGSSDDIFQSYTTTDESDSIYLDGQTIMPGFVDGHTHLIASTAWYGQETLAGAQEIALNYGYTTLVEKSFDDNPWIFDAEQANEIRLRLNLFPIYNYGNLDEEKNPIIAEQWYPAKEPILDHDRMVRVPGIKIYCDGANSNARGFPAVTIPYTPEYIAFMATYGLNLTAYGDLYFELEELKPIVKGIHDAGFTVACHAMGDNAVETVLDAYKYVLGNETNGNYRHQIEHNSYIRPDLITLARELGTLHSMRGYYPTYYQAFDTEYFNETACDWTMNRYSLPSEGVHAYWETDFSFYNYNASDRSRSANINPFLSMWSYVTKSAIYTNGTIIRPDPWVAEHLLTVEQALEVMTIKGAYTVKQEDYLGSLEEGKFADLIIISDDPLTIDEDDLKDLEVWLTMVGGVIEYQKADYDFPVTPTPPPSTTPPTSTSPTSTTTPTTGLTTSVAIPSLVFITGLATIIVVVLRKRRTN